MSYIKMVLREAPGGFLLHKSQNYADFLCICKMMHKNEPQLQE